MLLQTALGTWAHTNFAKVQAFVNHLALVFQPHPTNLLDEEEPLVSLLESPYQLEPSPPPPIETNRNSNSHQQPSSQNFPWLLIRLKILQELPPVGIEYITQHPNASLLLRYFPNQWKFAQIIILLKPGKLPNVPTSYHPISLLPTLSNSDII
jgi:hypothetical protein